MMHCFLIARVAKSFSFPCCYSAQIQLGSVLPHSASLFFNVLFTSSATFSEFESESQTNLQKGDTFTMSYLINSCGLSPEMAVKASKKVNLRNPDGPNAVLDLLKNHGFSKTQVANLVEKRPFVLSANAETTLLPKFKFLHSIGVSNTDLPKIIIWNGSLLKRSLESFLVPRCKALKSVLRNEKELVAALRNGARSFSYCDVENDLVLNIDVLRRFGVPQSSISYLVSNYPSVAYMKHLKFAEAANKAKEMGFDTSRTTFILAVQVLAKMNEAMWKSRLEVFERWGWSTDISLLAFKRFPLCMLLSENKIMKTMSFLVKDMGWLSREIAQRPSILGYSLEKRIIPRCNVVDILKSKGLLRNDISISSFMAIGEEKFLKQFVIRFQENMPLLLEVYKKTSREERVYFVGEG